MEKCYIKDLEDLKKVCDRIPNSRMMAFAKISTLIMLNMRYEHIMLDRDLDKHPYLLISQLVKDSLCFLSAWDETAFIEKSEAKSLEMVEISMEERHRELFQKLWVNFSQSDYIERIERFVKRLRINGLGKPCLKGLKCIDFGCGHGNFAHALIHEDAQFVYAFDFGVASIEYANKVRDAMGISSEEIEFQVGSVYHVACKDNSFDFAIQNGVFHHLTDENSAYREVWRVLKPGGWFWIYTDGSGAISHDLWDCSAYILRDIPYEFILSYLDYLNIETGKRYHLGDGLNATYKHSSLDELTKRLSRVGFGNVRRLVGGFPTDFDYDVIAEDKWGVEKFGEGDLRVLVQKKEV